MTFTMTFAGELTMPGNPFNVETPFGKPETIGKGDAFFERDVMEGLLAEIVPILEEAASRLRYSGDYFHDMGDQDRAEADWAASAAASNMAARALGPMPIALADQEAAS